MKKTDYSSWRRLERVIESSGLTINSFAGYVGLPRGENLYQIKRGNYGVSLGVAKKIHAKFPQYPISWLIGAILMVIYTKTAFPKQTSTQNISL